MTYEVAKPGLRRPEPSVGKSGFPQVGAVGKSGFPQVGAIGKSRLPQTRPSASRAFRKPGRWQVGLSANPAVGKSGFPQTRPSANRGV
jgi:hypothetical protein